MRISLWVRSGAIQKIDPGRAEFVRRRGVDRAGRADAAPGAKETGGLLGYPVEIYHATTTRLEVAGVNSRR